MCKGCGALHHKECYTEHGRCAAGQCGDTEHRLARLEKVGKAPPYPTERGGQDFVDFEHEPILERVRRHFPQFFAHSLVLWVFVPFGLLPWQLAFLVTLFLGLIVFSRR